MVIWKQEPEATDLQTIYLPMGAKIENCKHDYTVIVIGKELILSEAPQRKRREL